MKQYHFIVPGGICIDESSRHETSSYRSDKYSKVHRSPLFLFLLFSLSQFCSLLDLCLKFSGDEDDGVRHVLPIATAACLAAYTELQQEESFISSEAVGLSGFSDMLYLSYLHKWFITHCVILY